MPEPLNLRYFSDTKWLNAAKGANNEVTGWPESNGGIEMPTRVHLRLGQRYFRFASGKANDMSKTSGPWWVEFETLTQITTFAKQHSTPREAVRHLLSIPWEWSDVDKLVSAVLEKPLDAYRGKGKPAQAKPGTVTGAHPNDKATRYIPPHHLLIMQLFIPGLYDPDARADKIQIRKQAFPQPQITDIWTSSYFH